MKEEQTQQHRLLDQLLINLPIEKHNRSLLDSAVVIAHYLADYLIIWALLGTIIQTYTSPFNTIIPFLLSRVVLSVGFLVLKHPIFLLLDKIVIIVQVMTMTVHPFYAEISAVLCELAMCGMWALGKEQRQIHFDSSMGLGPLFAKQFMVYALLVLDSFYSNAGLAAERVFIIILTLMILYGIDSSQFYYKPTIKYVFIRLDQILLTLFLLIQLQSVFTISYFEFIVASLGLVLVVVIEMGTSGTAENTLFYLPIPSLQKLDQKTVAQHFVKAKLMVLEGKPEKIDSFLEKMAKETEDSELQSKLEKQAVLKSRESYIYKKDIIHSFLIQHLRNFSKQSSYILDLLIYLYSPDSRVFSCFDLSKWHHRREYFRILTDRSEETILQEFEFDKQKNRIRGVLLRCLQLRQLFYEELMREKVKQSQVLELGHELIETVEQFIEDKNSDLKQSPETIFLFHQFSEQCLSPYFAARITLAEASVFEAEGDPALLVGVRFERYKKILWVNNQFRKMGCYGYLGSKRLELDHIAGHEFSNFVLGIIESENHKKKDQFKEIKEELPLGWFFNSMGCVNACRVTVKNSHYDWDFCLNISFQVLHYDKAILLVTQTGKIIGVSDLARFFEISPTSLPHELNHLILQELVSHRVYDIKRGESLLSGNNLIIIDPFRLSIIDENKPKFTSEKVYVIEMATPSHKAPEQSICRKIVEPPAFEFNFNWNGRITSFKSQNVFPSAEESEKKRVEVAYGQNITEMRYFNEKIDYKANFDEERDCPSLPKQLQQHYQDISEEQFFNRIQRKKESTPLKVKVIYGLLIVLLVFSLFFFCLMMVQYKTLSEKNILQMTLLSKHNLKEQSIIKLATLTAMNSFNLGYNQLELIKAQIAQVNSLSSQIYNLDSSTMNSEEGVVLQNNLNSLNLIINSYLLNQNSATTNQALAMIPTIARAYEAYLGSLIDDWEVANSNFSNVIFTLLIVFGVICFFLLMIMALLEYQVMKVKEEIVQILKSIDNDDLTVSNIIVTNFRSIWLENEEPKDTIAENVNNEDSLNPTKRVVRCSYFHLRHILHIVWALIVFLTLVCLYTIILRVNTANRDYFSFNLYLSQHLCQINGIWGQLNATPLDAKGFSVLVPISFKTQQKKIASYRRVITNPYTDISSFYQPFWQTDKFCDYITEPSCRTIIGMGTREGANMIIAYLNQDYDRIYRQVKGGKPISEVQGISITAKIAYFYISQILSQNMQYIVDDYNRYIVIFWKKISTVFVLGLIFSSCIVFLFLYYKRFFRRQSNHEDLLLTIPFSKLLTITGFHRFYEKHYKDL